MKPFLVVKIFDITWQNSGKFWQQSGKMLSTMSVNYKFPTNYEKIKETMFENCWQKKSAVHPVFRSWIPQAVQKRVLCRSRRDVFNEYLVAKIGFDTEENEPCKVFGHLSDNRQSPDYFLVVVDNRQRGL